MLRRGKALTVTKENKLVLTLVPLQLGKAANCSCLDYFHYNLIPDFKREREEKSEWEEHAILRDTCTLCLCWSNITRAAWVLPTYHQNHLWARSAYRRPVLAACWTLWDPVWEWRTCSPHSIPYTRSITTCPSPKEIGGYAQLLPRSSPPSLLSPTGLLISPPEPAMFNKAAMNHTWLLKRAKSNI